MNRNCFKIDLSLYIDNKNNYSLFNSIEFFIDIEIQKEFIELLHNKVFLKKFRRIVHEILSNRYNDELYGKENVSSKAKDVTAMKFKSVDNLRIYCKENFSNTKKIIAILLINKKTQRNNNKLKNLIETIGGYDYDFDK